MEPEPSRRWWHAPAFGVTAGVLTYLLGSAVATSPVVAGVVGAALVYGALRTVWRRDPDHPPRLVAVELGLCVLVAAVHWLAGREAAVVVAVVAGALFFLAGGGWAYSRPADS